MNRRFLAITAMLTLMAVIILSSCKEDEPSNPNHGSTLFYVEYTVNDSATIRFESTDPENPTNLQSGYYGTKFKGNNIETFMIMIKNFIDFTEQEILTMEGKSYQVSSNLNCGAPNPAHVHFDFQSVYGLHSTFTTTALDNNQNSNFQIDKVTLCKETDTEKHFLVEGIFDAKLSGMHPKWLDITDGKFGIRYIAQK